MKLSYETAKKMAKILFKVRDTDRGGISECEFMSFCYTINKINDRLADQYHTVEGRDMSQYKLMAKFKPLILPREIRRSKSKIYLNLKCNELLEGHTAIEDHVYSVSNKGVTLSQEIQDAKDSKNTKAQSADAETTVKQRAEAPRIMKPNEFKLFQDMLIKQCRLKSDVDFAAIPTGEETQDITLNADIAHYSFDGVCLTNVEDGFRPIALKKDMFMDLNFNEFSGDAEENFVDWFTTQLSK